MPNQAANEAIAKHTQALFRQIDQGNRTAIETYASTQTGAQNFPSRMAEMWLFSRNKGVDFQNLGVMAVRWHIVNEGAQKGTFAEVHITSLTNAAHFACGKLIWQQNGPGFKVIRSEISDIPPQYLQGLSFDAFQAWTQRLGCVGFQLPQGVAPPPRRN